MATPLSILGAVLLPLERRPDARGDFLKVLHRPTLRALGAGAEVAECYVTTSRRGVIRGLHLQLPPHDHEKIVCCLAGRITDLLLDVRVGSPTFGQHVALALSGDEPASVVIPPGVAHGFECLSDEAVVLYHTSTVHAPLADAGIRWDSVSGPWREAQPILSERDRAFPLLADFHSPFRYSPPEQAP